MTLEKLILTVVPCGRGRMPDPPDMADARTQAQAALEAYQAGASVAHLHGNMRQDSGREPDFEHWAELTRLVRNRSDMIVQFGRAVMSPMVRKRLLELGPDMGSFLLGHHDILINSGQALHALCTQEEQAESARYHLEAGVLPECEVWHAGNLWNMRRLIEAGLLRPPFYATLFLGWPGGHWAPASPQELLSRVAALPPDTHWGLSVKGPQQVGLHALAITLGGHVRVGFEDNAELYPGVPARSNAQLVERIVRLARELGREVATPAEARAILGLPRAREAVGD